MSWFFKGVEHSQLYFRYRPTYPSEVFKTIVSQVSVAKSNGRWGSALDIGCGTGQSTLPLSDYFEEVIGIDTSETQLDVARKGTSDLNKQNVKYFLGEAHDLSFRLNNSVELITAAQSAHWFKLDKFYSESMRVLKPGGILALYGYGNLNIEKAEGQDILMQLYEEKLGSYWPKGRAHIENRYSDIYETFCRAFPVCQRDDSIKICHSYTVDELIGYLTTWSAYQRYRQENPHAADPIENTRSQFLSVFTKDSVEESVQVHFPVFILLGKKAVGAH